MNHMRPVMDRIEKYVQSGSLWDVGCGLGGLVGEARRRGWTAFGNDVRPELREPVKDAFLFQMDLGDFTKLVPSSERLQAVTFHHGIEHLPWPKQALAHAWKTLVPGGVVYMAHPHITNIETQGNTSISPGAHNYEWHADGFHQELDWVNWELLHHDRGGDSQYWLIRKR